MADELRKEVNIGIRSVLTSSATQLNINQLFNDYAKLIGTPIPLRSLGYRNLHEYLLSIPNVVSLDNPQSLYSIVRPVVDEKIRHIANFVKGQKVNKSVKSFRRPALQKSRANEFVPFDLRNRIYEILRHYPDGIHLDDFRSLVDKVQREMGTRCTFDVILDKLSFCTRFEEQYIMLTNTDQNPIPLKTPNEQIIGDESDLSDDLEEWFSENDDDYTYALEQTNGQTNTHGPPETAHPITRPKSQHSSSGSSARSGIELVSDTLVKNLYALLDENPKGIWLTDLTKKYEKKYGYSLNPQQHGFDCVLDLANTLKHVFYMMQYEKSGDRYLKDARKHSPDDDESDQGELPKSVVYDIKKMMQCRPKPQIYTDELAAEFKERYKKTLDPSEFGFPNMGCLLKSLIENESSTFSVKVVKNRALLYIRGSQQEESNDAMQNDAAFPDDVDFDIIPKEVCNYDFKLPVNPILIRITKGMRIRVKIAEVYSPERFFLHFADDVENLNMMMDDLHQFYERNGEDYELYYDTVRRGMLCACPFSGDSKWHRVQVITCRGAAGVKARFLDYGTAEDVPVNKLRYLHLDFARLPAMSIRSKLNGIKALPNEVKKGYSREVCESFFNLANVHYLEAEIVNADLTNLALEVYLHARQEDGSFINIHEKLIELKCVARKEIDSQVEAPSQNKPVISIPNFSMPVPKVCPTPNEAPVTKLASSHKSRPPPGIPVPPNMQPPATIPTANPVTSTPNVSTQNTNKPNPNAPIYVPNFNTRVNSPTTFGNVNPPMANSKMNPLNPPFYPASFVPPPPTQQPMPPQQPPMYGQPQRPYMYPQPMRLPPQYGMNYPPYGGMPGGFEYYYMSMRPPTYYVPPAPKPPPGFDYNPKPAPPPETSYFCGNPLFAGSKPAKDKGGCFNGTTLNTFCCCGFDCQTPPGEVNQAKSVPTKPTVAEKEDNDTAAQPEWILKLELLNDLIKSNNVSQEAVNERLGNMISEIDKNIDTRENAPKIETKSQTKNNTSQLSPQPQLRSPAKSEAEELFPKLQDLITTLNESNTKPVDSASSSRPESECSFKSDSKTNTQDDSKNEKLKELKMLVMLQNKNLKKL